MCSNKKKLVDLKAEYWLCVSMRLCKVINWEANFYFLVVLVTSTSLHNRKKLFEC